MKSYRSKLEALVWKHTHRDYRGTDEAGNRSILHFVTNVGTCSVTLASLSDAELFSKLPTKVREALGVS